MEYNLAAVRELVAAAFDDDGLSNLCFDHFRPVYDQFAAGQTKDARVRLLVDYARRQGRLAELLALVREANPHQHAIFEERLHAPEPVSPGDETALAAAEARLAELPLDEIPPITSLPPGSRMPFRANPLFVGREADLKALARTLKGGETAAIGQVAAATGMGGIGKTQLAAEFAHRYGQFFAGGVFWLSFGDPASIRAEIAGCGGPGGLELYADGSGLAIDEQVARVRAAWQSPLPRLLVFDNCEEEALLAEWRPAGGGARVLVTSRRGGWSPALGVQPLALGVLSRAESVALLRRFRPDLAEDEAEAIAAELGDLPLALHLAGSFLARYRHAVAPADYLAQLRQPDLLQHRSLTAGDFSPTGHELHVARTFALSYERLNPEDPTDALALALLSRAACFAPGEPIPRALLLASLEEEGGEADETLAAEDAVARLGELGLLEAEAGGALALHRLLAAFARGAAGEEAAGAAQAAVEAAVLAEANRLNNAGYPAPLLAWQPHLRTVTDAALARADERAAGLGNTLGYHLQMIGDYAGARPYYERALSIWEEALGPRHPDTAQSLNNLGYLLRAMGDLAGARPYYERALAILEEVLGPRHPDTANSLNNLGMLLQAQGDLAGARPYLERALAIWEEVLGPRHPATATSLNNLGALLYEMGDLAGARPYFERALAIWEEVFGPRHPATAQSLNNLGYLLQAQGDLAGARPYLERALAIFEEVLGPRHPATATSLNNLGYLLQAMGDLAGARPYYERALAIREEVLGPRHPDTAQSLNNLGALLDEMGDLAAARPYYERALAICEEALGPRHPATAGSLNNLGYLLQAMGDLAGARPYYERALAICEEVLGPRHPDTAGSLNNLGMLLKTMGDLAGARPYYERALAISEEVLGPRHPDTATSLNNLGMLLKTMGDLAGARPYFERALTIWEEVLGPDHRLTRIARKNLAALADTISSSAPGQQEES